MVDSDEQSSHDGNPDIVESVRAALISHFGHQPDSASVSFVGVEAISVLRFHAGDVLSYVTAGMSRYPLPDHDEHSAVAAVSRNGPRGELMLRVRARGVGADEVWRRLALLGAAPLVEGLRYGDGAVISLGEPLVPGSWARGVVVTDSGLDVLASTVTVFEVLPATAQELAWARVHGVAALRALWRDRGVDLTDLGRVQVELA